MKGRKRREKFNLRWVRYEPSMCNSKVGAFRWQSRRNPITHNLLPSVASLLVYNHFDNDCIQFLFSRLGKTRRFVDTAIRRETTAQLATILEKEPLR